MSNRPKNATGQMWLGVAFFVLGLIGLAMGIPDPSETTGRGIPVLLGGVVLCIGGAWFAIHGAIWRRRDKGR